MKREYYPLTHPQKAVWFTEKTYPGTSIRNISATLRIKGKVDYDILEKAVNLFIEKNDATRLRIIEKDGQPMQYITDFKYRKLAFYDFSGKDIAELYKWDEVQAKIPFKLIDSELIHFDLIKVNENDGGLFLRIHHLIADAWTISIMANQIMEYYSALKNEEDVPVLNHPSYIDYIKREEEYLTSERLQKDKAYWEKLFERYPEKTSLKSYNPKDVGIRARRKTILSPKKLTQKIHQYCAENKTSPFVLFVAALSMYINRVTSQDDINLGTTTLNRSNSAEKQIVGMFSNIVPIRIQIKDEMDFKTFAKIVTGETISLLKHQKYPYDFILKDVRSKYRIKNSIFDIVLIYQNAKLTKSKYNEEYITRWHFNGYQPEALNISINDRENDGQLIIDYSYLTDLFNVKEIEFINQHVINILWHALDDPAKKISNLNMLSEIERHKVLFKFNEIHSDNVNGREIYDLSGQFTKQIPETTKCYILDKNLNPLPISIPGELFVSDEYAVLEKLGVVDRPVQNSSIPEQIIYQTGFRARWYPNGDIVILEKIDQHSVENDRNLRTQGIAKEQINIAATFTAEPVGDYIRWWGKNFGCNFEIEFAGYNQVFQELLDKDSKLSKNRNGINILLVRFEDFIRNSNETEEKKVLKLEQVFIELELALAYFDNYLPLLIPVFPLSTHLGLSETILNKIEELNTKIKDSCAKHDHITVLDFNGTDELYIIEEVFDIVKDKEAHMPFTEEYYAAIGTQLARKICAMKGQQYKVIVLDCDNTLWEGTCGEQGVTGVNIRGAYKELQEFMLQKYQEGMLLTICSKNNEQDVWQVFNENPGMILGKEHITSWKINWQEKSQNIREIAKELNLSLDSFIFIDDSPLECSKMIENCSEVLTLKLPSHKENIPLFLRHVWAFDRGKTTQEDTLRSRMYQAENQRKEILEPGISLDEYVKKLELKISMREVAKNEVTRASQLTQRTNQFNLSTIRRTEEEIRQLIQDKNTISFVIEASDKFGDYGIVGLVILQKDKNLFLDTFLLSCRILGRKVEDVILSGIKRYAEHQGIQGLEAVLAITEKNKPIQEFLNRTNWNQLYRDGIYIRYTLNISDLPENIEHVEFYFNEKYKKEPEIIETIEEAFELDHVAIAVQNLQEAEDYYRTLGYKVIDSVFDPLQNSYLSMCISNQCIPIELVAPVNEESPSFNKLEMQGEVPYHLCYRVANIERFLERIQNIDYQFVSPPKPAILFHQQKVAFIMIKKVGLIELLETGDQTLRPDRIKNYRNNLIKMVINDKNKALEFYKILGYIQEKNIKDTDRNILITQLIGRCGEKIELIYPLNHNTVEYEFLTRSGAGIYQICYGVSELENLKHSASCREYMQFSKTEESKKKASVDHDLCDIGILTNQKYKKYLLPIFNFTGERLLQLPIFEEVEREVAVCQEPTNEIEEKLVRIWERALRTQNIGVNVDFFELGGDSLSAVNILAWVNKEFNVELTLREIFELRTINELANKIADREKDNITLESLVLISKRTANNLFLIHAGNGEIIPYLALAKVLKSDYSIWGIRFRKLNNFMPCNITLEKIAEDYIQQIKKIQPEGPYCLAGWSFGGVIAFEMARQLEENGEDIEFIGLIDSASSVDWPDIKEFNLENEKQLIISILDDKDQDIIGVTKFEDLWPVFIEKYRNRKGIIDRIKKEIPESVKHAVPNYNDIDLSSIIYYLNVMRTLNNARALYYPKTKIKTAYYFSVINDDMMIQDQSTNISEWQKNIQDRIKVYTISGNHYSIFDKDIHNLAETMQKALELAANLVNDKLEHINNISVLGDHNGK